jgi:Ran-binding protein 9/10
VGSIQANCAVPRRRRLYYYEITVKDAGDRGCIAIGFAPPDYKAGRQPGSVPDLYTAMPCAHPTAQRA